MKKVLFILCASLISMYIKGQETITITDCYELARSNYPLIKQYELIDKLEQYNLANAGKGWLPQFSVNARATYQNDVTKLPFDNDWLSGIIPGFSIPTLSKDQYQVAAELTQTVWDGGIIRSARKLTRAQAMAEREKTESELYNLNERVNQLYFGCLLQDALINQNIILQKELQTNMERIIAMIDNGVANESDKESLEVELLNARQQEIELKSGHKAYRRMLGVLIGKDITENTKLLPPSLLNGEYYSSFQLSPSLGDWGMNRPELRALDAQRNLTDTQNKQITAGLMPRIGLFVQGGYGRPGLNMLEDSFEPFYIAGVRLSWNLGKLYTVKNDRRKIETNLNAIDVKKDIFLFNVKMQLVQQHTEIQKMNELLKSDEEIVRLRTNIKKAAEVKLENGVISVTDLIREINAEDLAKQSVATHRIRQLMSIHNYMYTTNNK